MVGFARTPKLPWDEYAITAYDFAPYWWDPNTEGASNGLYLVGKGVGWYPDGAKVDRISHSINCETSPGFIACGGGI